MEELIKLAATQGIWCVLSIWLVLYTLKTSKEREDALQKNSKEREDKLEKISTDRESRLQHVIEINQNIICELTKKLDIVDDVKQDVEEIKIEILKINNIS